MSTLIAKEISIVLPELAGILCCVGFDMGQTLLFPDPKPLDQRLGRKFFRRAPRRPGVYLMKNADDKVLYVGNPQTVTPLLEFRRPIPGAHGAKMPGESLDLTPSNSRFI